MKLKLNKYCQDGMIYPISLVCKSPDIVPKHQSMRIVVSESLGSSLPKPPSFAGSSQVMPPRPPATKELDDAYDDEEEEEEEGEEDDNDG